MASLVIGEQSAVKHSYHEYATFDWSDHFDCAGGWTCKGRLVFSVFHFFFSLWRTPSNTKNDYYFMWRWIKYISVSPLQFPVLWYVLLLCTTFLKVLRASLSRPILYIEWPQSLTKVTKDSQKTCCLFFLTSSLHALVTHLFLPL